LSPKDAEAINSITGGALCSITGFICPNEGEEIADNVKAGADIVQAVFIVKSLAKLSGLSLAAIAAVIRKNPKNLAKIAARVTKDFKNLECMECAQAMLKEFEKAGIKGTVRELGSKSDLIVKAGETSGDAISLNGRHFGVQVGERVYDLYHPQGIALGEWASAYKSTAGVELLPLGP
jgi:hypothetical protein